MNETFSNRTQLGIFSKLLMLVLLSTLAARFTVVGRGALASHDELRYLYALEAALDVYRGDWQQGLDTLYQKTNARPGCLLLWLPPIAWQILTTDDVPSKLSFQSTGIERRQLERVDIPASYLEPSSLVPAQVYNIIISLITVALFYCLALIFFNRRTEYALLAAVIYSLMGNNTIYLRHLYPYEGSLVCLFSALLLTCRIGDSSSGKGLRNFLRKSFLVGLLCGIGFSFYPGYFLFCVIVFVQLMYCLRAGCISGILRNALGFFYGLLTPLAMLEILSLFTDNRLSSRLVNLSGSVTHGSSAENVEFIGKYLYAVDGWFGVFLLGTAIVSLLLLSSRFRARKRIAEGGKFPVIGLPVQRHWMLPFIRHSWENF